MYHFYKFERKKKNKNKNGYENDDIFILFKLRYWMFSTLNFCMYQRSIGQLCLNISLEYDSWRKITNIAIVLYELTFQMHRQTSRLTNVTVLVHTSRVFFTAKANVRFHVRNSCATCFYRKSTKIGKRNKTSLPIAVVVEGVNLFVVVALYTKIFVFKFYEVRIKSI